MKQIGLIRLQVKKPPKTGVKTFEEVHPPPPIRSRNGTIGNSFTNTSHRVNFILVYDDYSFMSLSHFWIE